MLKSHQLLPIFDHSAAAIGSSRNGKPFIERSDNLHPKFRLFNLGWRNLRLPLGQLKLDASDSGFRRSDCLGQPLEQVLGLMPAEAPWSRLQPRRKDGSLGGGKRFACGPRRASPP